MNEDYQVETMETAEMTEGTPEVDISAFDDGWDDDGQTGGVDSGEADVDETDSDTHEADQPSEEVTVDDNKSADEAAAPETAEEETKGQAEDKADQLFTLKHLDETRNVNRDEVITLAQKGMDYDRKVGKLNSELAEYKGFFEELAANSGLSTEQFIDSVRAKMLVAQEGKAGRQLSEADAIFRVQKARADKAQAKAAAEAEAANKASQAEQRKAAEAIAAFTKAYPTVKRDDIPKEVWDEVSQSGDLLGAYTRHIAAQTAKENEALKKKLAALENNAKNTSRSIGSKKTAGSAKAMDDFDAGWDSI